MAIRRRTGEGGLIDSLTLYFAAFGFVIAWSLALIVTPMPLITASLVGIVGASVFVTVAARRLTQHRNPAAMIMMATIALVLTATAVLLRTTN